MQFARLVADVLAIQPTRVQALERIERLSLEKLGRALSAYGFTTLGEVDDALDGFEEYRAEFLESVLSSFPEQIDRAELLLFMLGALLPATTPTEAFIPKEMLKAVRMVSVGLVIKHRAVEHGLNLGLEIPKVSNSNAFKRYVDSLLPALDIIMGTIDQRLRDRDGDGSPDNAS
jgi:hypothetical protein